MAPESPVNVTFEIVTPNPVRNEAMLEGPPAGETVICERELVKRKIPAQSASRFLIMGCKCLPKQFRKKTRSTIFFENGRLEKNNPGLYPKSILASKPQPD